jgi:hypothetical protein
VARLALLTLSALTPLARLSCDWIPLGVAYRGRVTVKAWLEGHQFDLQDLAELLSSGDVRVVREDDRYYLTSPGIDNPPQGATYFNVAASLLTHINGLARVKNPSFRPVRLTGDYTDGESQHKVVAPLSAELRLRGHVAGVVTGPDGQPKPDPPSPWPDRFALRETNPDVLKVLQIMGRSVEGLNWFALFKVYEIIVRAVGSEKEIQQNGWATNAQQKAFRGSANLEKVSGDAARHAVDKGTDHPKQTMTIEEGQSFISELVTKWLQTL